MNDTTDTFYRQQPPAMPPLPEASEEEQKRFADKLAAIDRELAQRALQQQLDDCSRSEALARIRDRQIDLKRFLPEPKPVIARHGQLIGSEGNLSAVVGEAKSKKTFLCSAIVAGALQLEGSSGLGFDRRMMKIVWLDTEQSELHVRRVMQRINRLSGWNGTGNDPRLFVYSLREYDPRVRLETLRDALEAHRPKLLVVDGISDLQYNTNDLEESERIVTELMRLSTDYACHILCVLHTNPNSDKARGHLGSSLQRKAETVLFVHRVCDRSLVEPQFCRNEPFERFAFRIDDEALPVAAPLPAEESGASSVGECLRLVRDEYGGAIERRVLLQRMQQDGASPSCALMRLRRALQRGELRLSEDERLVCLPGCEAGTEASPPAAAAAPTAVRERAEWPEPAGEPRFVIRRPKHLAAVQN